MIVDALAVATCRLLTMALLGFFRDHYDEQIDGRARAGAAMKSNGIVDVSCEVGGESSGFALKLDNNHNRFGPIVILHGNHWHPVLTSVASSSQFAPVVESNRCPRRKIIRKRIESRECHRLESD